MKTLAKMLIVLAIVSTACTSSRYAVNQYDDIYYSPNDDQVTETTTLNTTETDSNAEPADVDNYTSYEDKNYEYGNNEDPSYSNTDEYVDDDGNSYVSNNYYYDDYDSDD